jgi:nitronate monooxygenase
MATESLLQTLGIETPIMAAPMGGGPSTPELVAAVSNAGGMGWLAGAYLTPEQIVEQGQRVRELTDKPFGINLFVGAWTRREPAEQIGPMLELLAEAHARLGLTPPSAPSVPLDPFPGQLEAVLDVAPAAFSFTFGVLRAEDLDRLQAAGIKVFGTATTVREARILADSGVDGIAAQGAEAAAHRGTFAGAFEQSMVPTLELVAAIHAAVDLPILAAGGLMDGCDIRSALDCGASAALLGTAYLACPESGISPPYREALMHAEGAETVVTRAYSGRPARGLNNTFIRLVEDRHIEIPPYPLQNAMTRAMRTAAGAANEAGYLSLWAGQGVGRIRPMPAGKLTELLRAELEEAGCGAGSAQTAGARAG